MSRSKSPLGISALTNIIGTMDGITDPQPSPENLRQHQGDQSSPNVSLNEDVVREDFRESEVKETAYEETESPGLDYVDTGGPIPKNITISEEQEDQDTAFKPRLRSASSEPCILRAFNKREPISENITNSEEAQKDGPGFTSDWDTARVFLELEKLQRDVKRTSAQVDESFVRWPELRN